MLPTPTHSFPGFLLGSVWAPLHSQDSRRLEILWPRVACVPGWVPRVGEDAAWGSECSTVRDDLFGGKGVCPLGRPDWTMAQLPSCCDSGLRHCRCERRQVPEGG